MFHRMGREAFMAERQQEPIDQIAEAGPYHLTADVVLRRVDAQRKPLARPAWVTRVLASSDVNPSYGFSSVVLGFGEDQSAVVLWYGIHKLAIPGDLPALELGRRLFAELTAHGKALAGLPVGAESWAIDAGGGNFDGVLAFAAAASRVCGIPAFGFTGRGAKNYRQTGKTAAGPFREQCHGCLDHKDGRAIRRVGGVEFRFLEGVRAARMAGRDRRAGGVVTACRDTRGVCGAGDERAVAGQGRRGRPDVLELQAAAGAQ